MKRGRVRWYFAVVVCALLVLLGSLVLFFADMNNGLEQFSVQRVLNETRMQALAIEDVLDGQFALLRSMAAWLQSNPDTDTRQALDTMAAMVQSTDFSRLAVVDAKGIALYNDGTQADLSDQTCVQRALLGNENMALLHPNYSDECLALALPVCNEQGEVRSALLATYPLKTLSDKMYYSLYGNYGYFFVVNAQGKTVVDDSHWRPERDEGLFDYYADTEFLMQGSLDTLRQDFAQRRADSFFLKRNGVEGYLAYVPLPYTNWMLCYVVSAAQVRQQYGFIQDSQVDTLLLVGAALALSLVVLFLCIRHDYHRLEHRARTDQLTGLLNKMSTQWEIDRRLADCPAQAVHALLILDMDDFKSVNDTEGHAAGDAMLAQMGTFLKEHFRSSDVLGRIGGDEFVVFLSNLHDVDKAAELLSAAVKHYNELPPPSGCTRTPYCSAGMAFAPNDGRTFAALYKHADQALYKAKRSGKNRAALYQREEKRKAQPPVPE